MFSRRRQVVKIPSPTVDFFVFFLFFITYFSFVCVFFFPFVSVVIICVCVAVSTVSTRSICRFDRVLLALELSELEASDQKGFRATRRTLSLQRPLVAPSKRKEGESAVGPTVAIEVEPFPSPPLRPALPPRSRRLAVFQLFALDFVEAFRDEVRA